MGQPPACGHHSQGSLQRLAHSTLPSPVGGLPGQPFVAPTIRSGGLAHGRARTPVGRAAGTACPQHALGSASALHALPRRRHHHPCSLTGRRSSHTGGQHQPPLSGDWSQDADSQGPPAWASAAYSTLQAPMQTPASHSVQQGQPSHTWASHSARTQTLRPTHSTQPSCSASTGASHAGQASGSAC